jgi:hypothetical protein
MTKKGWLTVTVLTAAIISPFFMAVGWYRYNYPFGMDHRCDKCLWFELMGYAERHGGAFPSGQKTPEASLSQIGGKNAYLLHRRDVPCDDVQGMLDRGQLLGPETCGWNYVEGLRLDSNPELALFWDKEGLSEMGARLSDGGHFVSFVGHPYEYVPASRWHNFLKEQQKLLAQEKAKTQNR